MSRTLSHRFPLDAVPAANRSDLSRRTGYPLRTIQRWRVDGIPYWSLAMPDVALSMSAQGGHLLVHTVNGLVALG